MSDHDTATLNEADVEFFSVPATLQIIMEMRQSLSLVYGVSAEQDENHDEHLYPLVHQKDPLLDQETEGTHGAFQSESGDEPLSFGEVIEGSSPRFTVPPKIGMSRSR